VIRRIAERIARDTSQKENLTLSAERDPARITQSNVTTPLMSARNFRNSLLFSITPTTEINLHAACYNCRSNSQTKSCERKGNCNKPNDYMPLKELKNQPNQSKKYSKSKERVEKIGRKMH